MPADWRGVVHWGEVGRTVFLLRNVTDLGAGEVGMDVEVAQGSGFNKHLPAQLDPVLPWPVGQGVYIREHFDKIMARATEVESGAFLVRGDPMFLKDSVGRSRGTLIRPSSARPLEGPAPVDAVTAHEQTVEATVALYGVTGNLPELPRGGRRLYAVPDLPAPACSLVPDL